MSSAAAQRLAVMPRSVSIAQSNPASSLSLSACGSLLSRVPPPIVAVVCSWLECVELLIFFRLNRSLVAFHHRTPPACCPGCASPLSSHRASWVASAWSGACMPVIATRATLFLTRSRVARFSRDDSADNSADRLYSPLFPDMDEDDQPTHLCRLVLAATPHLRHLQIHMDSGTFGYQADMADVLDLLPALHTLLLSADMERSTDHDEIYVPLSDVLARHPRLHTLQLQGWMCLHLSMDDVLGVALHPALAHIDVEATLHHNDDDLGSEIELFFHDATQPATVMWDREWHLDRSEGCSHAPCPACASDSLPARLAFLRSVQAAIIEHGHAFEHTPHAVMLTGLIAELASKQEQ